MGLFRRKKKVAVDTTEIEWTPEAAPIEKVSFTSADEKEQYEQEKKKDRSEWEKELQEAKDDYADVTSHLKDIQLIDRAPDEEKKILLDIADGVNQLQQERKRLQKREYKITPAQRKAFDTFSSRLRQDAVNVKELSEYKVLVTRDLKNLHAERKGLNMEKRSGEFALKRLNAYAKGIGVLMLMLFAAIALAYQYYEFDYLLCFTLVVAFGAAGLACILLKANKERKSQRLVDRKINRAIIINNKLKIKYVNTMNTLDYTFSKYRVKDYDDFELVRHEFIAQKEEWDRQKEMTKLLTDYSHILSAELRKIGVADTEIWFYQANALCDPREMVEVRHELNERRRKLREKIDFNSKLME